jgi:hypothetical protein
MPKEQKAKRASPLSVERCAVLGCERQGRFVRGYCMAHYERWRKYGDPLGGGCLKGDPVMFLLASLRHLDDACLIWPYARLSNGYASVLYEGRSQIASRVVCRLASGEPPTSRHEAAHSCGQGHRGCINPKHLYWATPEQNQADRVVHGTSNRGERQWASKLTEGDVRRIRKLFVDGWTNKEIAELFDVEPTTVRMIRTGASWAWLDAPQPEMAA